MSFYSALSQIIRLMRPTWGPPGSCRPHMGPMLAPWTLLSGVLCCCYCTILWPGHLQALRDYVWVSYGYGTSFWKIWIYSVTGVILIQILTTIPLRWRHNGRDSVSNHQPRDCLLNPLFRCRSKKTSKRRVTGLCAGNSPGTGEFPARMASNGENVSIWWRHHEFQGSSTAPPRLGSVLFLAATKQLYEWFNPSVCHTLFTIFPWSHHHEIFNSYYQWQKWGPCKRSKSEVKATEDKTPLSRFWTVTPLWNHIWWWNDGQNLMLLSKRGALLFFKVIRIERFRTVTPVWIHRWIWNDAQSLM